MKSKLLIGALVAAFALSASTDVVFAAKAKAHHAAKHKAMMMNMTDANKVPNCGKGKVPVWHMMGKAHWTCSKPA